MKLYEINTEIAALLIALEPDPETGEIPSNEDEIIAQINALAMKREDILQYLAKLTLNCRAEIMALKMEEDRLKKRRYDLDAKAERLLKILDRECDGETTDLGVATLSHRKTSKVEVTDETRAVNWLKVHGSDQSRRADGLQDRSQETDRRREECPGMHNRRGPGSEPEIRREK